MSIEEFVHQFEDVIPYRFSLKVGGNRIEDIKIDKTKISSKNHKGKLYPFYKKEVVGTTKDYIPFEEVNVPISFQIQCDYPHRLKWEKFSKTTNKERTEIEVRLLHEMENRQFGYVSLDLNSAGDMTEKFCSYYNADGTHEIMQYIFYYFNEETKEINTKESLSYILKNFETGMEERVNFSKTNGKLVGITISKNKQKNPVYESIVWSKDNLNEKEFMFSRCFSEKLLMGISPTCDITNSIINQDFIYRRNRIKIVHRLLRYEKDEKNKSAFNFRMLKQELKELLDPKNNVFGGFVGDYIGNTIIKKDGKLLLIVETVKDTLHYFTQIDITNTNAFDVDFYQDRYDSTLYYNAIRSASKMPMFRIKIENEDDVLVPFGENVTKEELQSYNDFKSYCLESFATIQSKKLSTLSLKSLNEKKEQNALSLKRKKI